ncbi:iron chelate uptake ABC transporter family permease subunit [Streptomyces sp. NPDC050528]|uniref:iron chelate uptake ABC transporter family permease subunit n=1 Tax=Streptomyces sp. NPDC050528 TaxID=3365623 RepID=UPI0037911F33
MCGGFATAVAVYLLAWKQGVHGYRLILVGIGASAVLGSATSFLYVRADIGKAAQAASWLIGSLNSRGWSDVWTIGIGLAVLVPVVIGYGRRLTLLELGDDTAADLATQRVTGSALLPVDVVTGVGGQPLSRLAATAGEAVRTPVNSRRQGESRLSAAGAATELRNLLELRNNMVKWVPCPHHRSPKPPPPRR